MSRAFSARLLRIASIILVFLVCRVRQGQVASRFCVKLVNPLNYFRFFPGLLSLGAFGGAFGGIVWWAHVGGFVFGLIMANFFALPRRDYREWDAEEQYPKERDIT